MFIAEELFEKAEKKMKESNYQYNLIYGKMSNGKYYVRPVSGNVLYAAETEEKAKEYIDVYNILRFIGAREELSRGKELKVYRMDDYEWWVSDKTEEETIEAFVEEYGEESRSIVDDIRECNLESEGMFWDFENPYVNDLIKNILGGQSQREVKIGDLEVVVAYIEGYCVYIPFEKAIQLEEYTKPHILTKRKEGSMRLTKKRFIEEPHTIKEDQLPSYMAVYRRLAEYEDAGWRTVKQF